MSRVRPPQDEWSRINALEERIANLERSNALQGTTASAIDGSGITRLLVGEIADSLWGLELFDSAGHELLQLDSAGLHLYDTNRTELVRLDSTGLHVLNGAGVMQAVGGTLYAKQPSIVSGPDLDLGTSVVATVGASGEVWASWTCNIQAGVAGGECFLYLDGVASGAPVANYGGGGGSTTVGQAYLLQGLTPGSHTFSLHGTSGGGDSLTWGNSSLTLQVL